ncbi:hypothetical protein LJC48_01760 [Desulfovibrio sp. OttesenSCG-928-C06]|nr:hypothetical protein [Desulfovibrio sp. OttesenSCG-928-C06]
MGQVAEVYRLLGADAVYVSPKAASWLTQDGGKLPENFWQPQAEPISRIFEVSGRRVGVVFFRAAPQTATRSTTSGNTGSSVKSTLPIAQRGPLTEAELASHAAYLEEAAKCGRQLAPQVDLLIGVSPWGYRVERHFIGQTPGLYHILLGGGSGLSFPYASTEGGYPLIWSRPYPEGRSVNLIKLYEWPQPGISQWTPEISFGADFEDLGSSIPSDPEIAGLLPQY